MTTIRLDNSKHIFVIAEAGSNWKSNNYNDDLERAKKLIKIAAQCGADAIKFQTYNANDVYVPNAGKSNYLSKLSTNKPITEIFKEFSMPYKMLKVLTEYCHKHKILFMSTPFSVRDAEEVNEHVLIHKVASYEINHTPLLKFLSKTKKFIILSTGASTYEEIDFAIKYLRKNNAKKIALLQCTAKYPAPLNSLNLAVIPEFKKKYSIPVGLSDHSMDPVIVPILAIGLGATIIEKHFTISRKFRGPDHFFALEPRELKIMIQSIRNSEKIMGSQEKKILKIEIELRRFAVRSVQATKEIQKGDIFRRGYNIDLLRPGNQKRGAEARFINYIESKKSLRRIKIGEGVRLEDYN